MITLLALSPVAHALPPNREVRLWAVGDTSAGAIERMALTTTGDVLVGRSRGDEDAWLVDVDRWDLVRFSGPSSGCSVNGVAPVALDDGTSEIWVACAEGHAVGYGWDGEALFEVYSGTGPLSFDVDTQLSGIWYDPLSELFYALSQIQTNQPTIVHVLDPFSETVDAQVLASYPKTLPANGFVEATVDDGYLLTSHGSQDMSSLLLGDPNAVATTNTFTTPFNCQDLAPAPFPGSVYCVDPLGSVAEFQPLGGGGFTILPLGVLDAPQAVAASLDLSDGWLAVTGDQVKVWRMDSSGGIPDTTPYFEGPPAADNPIQDMVTDDGYLFGGGEGGNLHIVTARPWVYPEKVVVSADFARSGDTVTITFQVDTESDWVLNAGGDRHGGGTRLASGHAEADTDVVVPLVVDDKFAEGDNGLYVIATDPLTSLTGHARGTLLVDDPPGAPALTDANVKFGDGELVLSFEGIKDEDLARYEIYASIEEWDGADWPTGGPEWDGSTELRTPIVVQAAGSESVTQRIFPLQNGVKVYLGVRAYDQGGLEGPMSRVVKGMPAQTFSVSGMVGDEGGTPCRTGIGGGAWLGLGALALALGRRSRRSTAAAVALLVLLAPRAASAQDDDEDHWWKQDTTPTFANAEIRYGTIELVDQRIEDFYDLKPHDIVYLEVGPQFFHVLELDYSFGFMQDLAFTRAADGRISGERSMLSWWPMALDATLRAHLVDEQPVVPFVRYGWDYLLWSEKEDAGPQKITTNGGKFGTHFAVGANVLLDVLQPGRASFLETQTGINDSWITIEWRRQRVDARATPWDGRVQAENSLDFSGDSITAGLKLDW